MDVPDRLFCSECGGPIPNTKRAGVGEWVQGLRINRQQGGPNQIRSWRGLGVWMCHQCAPMYDPATNTITEPLF